MIRFTLLALLFSLSLSITAQPSTFVFKVVFRDKAHSDLTLNDPAGFLSPRAIERRQRKEIPVTEDDLPISPSYLQAIEDAGGRILARSKWLNTVIVELDNKEKLDQIRQLEFVGTALEAGSLMKKGDQADGMEDAESYSVALPSYDLKSASATLAFDYGPSLNQIEMINGTGLHNEGYTGKGMVIAVLDAGFWKVDSMPVFDSLWANNQILGTRNYVNPDESVFDASIHQHGMMVLSIMGGNLPGQLVGTAPGAGYYLIRTEDAGPGNPEYLMEEYFWVMGAEYADSVGADIINSSLGYTVFDNEAENHTYADMDGNTTPITIGADKAAKKGILVTNSAGNSFDDPWLYIGAPADGDSVFTIGAVDALGNHAAFSSIGPTSDGRLKPNIVAQGQETIIAAPWGGITGGSGTSFSSPVIAGMTACLWQANRDFSNMEIIEAIQQSASQYDDPDFYLGYGIPDYQQANDMLGTIEIKAKPGYLPLALSPNPFSGHIQLSFENHSAQTIQIEVYDMTGKLIINQNQAINSGDVLIVLGNNHLSLPGLYFIRLITRDGIYTGKALKIANN